MLAEDYKPGPPNRRVEELELRPLELAVAPSFFAGLSAAATALLSRKTTRGQFAVHLLSKIGDPRMNETRMLMLMAWMQAEGDAGRFNPLNATWQMTGSTTFNSAGVQNYVSFDQGVAATALTLNYGAKHDEYGYKPIRHALNVGSRPSVGLAAVEASSWGTGGLALRVYEDTPNKTLLTLKHHRLAGA